MVATARRSLADGDLTGAVETYARAEAAFGTAAGKDLARRERTAVQQWLSPKPMPRSEWIDVIRRATIESPVAVAAAAGRLPGPTGRLAEAVGCALEGRRRDAARLLLSCSSGGDTSALLGAVAEGLRVLGLPGPCLATPSELAQCLDQLEQVPLPWLAFMVRRLLARRKDGRAPAVDAGALGPWATAVVSMIEGIDDAAGPGPSASAPGVLGQAAASFDRLGAPVVATWCLAWQAVALARGGAPIAVERCVAAAGRARAGAVPGALALASQAMAVADELSAPAHQSEAAAIASEWCVDLVPFELLEPAQPHPSTSSRPVGTGVAPTERSPRPITLRCFGGFSLSIDGRTIDVTTIKPKARAVLYVVAMGAGRLVHRETIGEAVWPDMETKVSLRNLQVALSAIRRLLQPDGPSRTGAALIREGDAYRLGLSERADVDVITFEQSLASARRAERGSEEMTAALSTALDAYRGDVLPEAGPAEWVIKLRDSYRTEAVGAALRLAEGFLAREQWRAAIRACERGLRIDAYQDGLWHVMVDAQTASGDRAAASRSRVAYDAVLGELGLAPATSPPRPHQGRSGVRPGDRART